MDVPRRFTASAVWVPQFSGRNGLVANLYKNWQISTIVSAQSGRPFSPYCSAPSKLAHNSASGALVDLGCDYNLDGGGGMGAVSMTARMPQRTGRGEILVQTKGLHQRALQSKLSFRNPCWEPTAHWAGTSYRGPRQTTTNLALGRNFGLGREQRISIPRGRIQRIQQRQSLSCRTTILLLALQSNGTYSSTSIFGKSTKAFDPRVFQLSAKIVF
jgi:hypothetical protein